jgi:DNA polymerase III epsilon subunit-like protein
MLFFDTETTGIPRNYKAPASDTRNWPRMVQIAWILVDKKGEAVACAEHIIRPDGFTIPTDAARIHGITTEIALKQGVALGSVLDEFAVRIAECSGVVAHNVAFDERIVGAEFLRTGRPNLIETKSRYCTMKSSTAFCALPSPYGYKWPTLTELHVHLFGEPFDHVHSAFADVLACVRCYKELKRLNIMN